MNKNLIFLLAPSFFELPLRVSELLIEKGFKIGFYCVNIGHRIEEIKYLGLENILFIDDLKKYESEWINNKNICNFNDLEIYNLLNIIVADRRLGRPFIHYANTRRSSFDNFQRRYGYEEVALRYISGLHKLVYDNNKKFKINSVILYVVASSESMILYQFYKKLIGQNLKVLTPSRIDDLYYFSNNLSGVFQNKQHEKEELLLAREHINKFRKKNTEPEYMINVNSEFHNIKFFGEISKLILYVPALLLKQISFGSLFSGLNILKLRHKVFYVRHLFNKSFKILNFKPDEPDYSKKYIYFPLHVDPEASTMVLSPLYTNQLFVIETLLKVIPNDHYLYVKEHKPMIGIRHKSFYDKLKKLPKVRLLSPFNDQFELIKHSKFVAAITGTVGLEALMLNIPVILFGNANYEVVKEGIIHVNDIKQLEYQIKNFKPNIIKWENQLINFIATLKEKSFPLKDDAITVKFNELDKKIQDSLITDFFEKIIKN